MEQEHINDIRNLNKNSIQDINAKERLFWLVSIVDIREGEILSEKQLNDIKVAQNKRIANNLLIKSSQTKLQEIEESIKNSTQSIVNIVSSIESLNTLIQQCSDEKNLKKNNNEKNQSNITKISNNKTDNLNLRIPIKSGLESNNNDDQLNYSNIETALQTATPSQKVESKITSREYKIKSNNISNCMCVCL